MTTFAITQPRVEGQRATPEMIATLEHERDRMTDRIRCLSRNRDVVTGYLDAVLEYDRTGTVQQSR
ncbi:hypothetical protein ACH347_36410 [Saccharopolyspora sp. 5N102]|uniref:hypothetical protein n=1 Tax=Saccharopolyspora sp. 5N102 TaxID=3375155 RepID=UPI003790644E